jgi:hypothetical protein
MKKSIFYALSFASFASILTGCASYSASTLNNLSGDIVMYSPEEQKGMPVVSAKAFDKADCLKFLDRNVLKKGYQPVQLYIQNHSDKSYAFSLNRMSIPCARPEEVAGKVHTSTVGRVVGYGVAACFVAGLLFVPAIVDGIKSAQANDNLDADFSSKTAQDTVIYPYSTLNKLIFIDKFQYQSSFQLTLIELETKEPKVFQVNAS